MRGEEIWRGRAEMEGMGGRADRRGAVREREGVTEQDCLTFVSLYHKKKRCWFDPIFSPLSSPLNEYSCDPQ